MTIRPLARALAAGTLALLAACAGTRRAAAPAPPAAAEPARYRTFVLPGHGRLLLAVPPGWTVSEDEDAEVATIRLARDGARFVVLLTPFLNPGEPEAPAARADAARLFAELGRRRALGTSVEREIPLEELSGDGVRGAWFSATDRTLAGREPGEDEYRHVLQGAAAVGPMIIAFTLLDDAPGPWRSQVIELVRTARHLREGEDEVPAGEGAQLEPVPADRTVPLRVRWPEAGWALLVDLPGFRLGARPAAAGGTPFVVGLEPERGFAASVSLSPAASAPDAAGCRERALASIVTRVAGVTGLRRGDAGAAATARYALSGGAAPELHLHAFLFRAGVCAGVHVSKVDPEPEDGARLEAILSTVRIAEDL